jgi:hypothetical protein
MTRFLQACLLVTSLVSAASAQSLTDRFKEVRGPWEAQLERGEASTVRKGVEAVLAREGLTVNPSDYNDMYALVAFQSLAARACASEGSWEDAVSHLQKAQTTATENLATAEPLLAKTRQDHELKLKEFREAMDKQAPRLKELEEAPGLNADQIKLRQQLTLFMEEQKAAIAHSERSLKDIETILLRLRDVKDSTTKASSDWQAFLAKEKADVAEAGDTSKYVSEKLEQVKADDARPRSERLTYARRLQKLDPTNPGVTRLVNALLGKEEASEPPKPKSKAKRKKSAKKS